MTGRNGSLLLGRKGILLLTGAAALGGLAGCRPGNLAPITSTGQPVKPTAVLFVPAPPASLAVNASTAIDASAIYPVDTVLGSDNTAVTYSLSCGSPGACGTFSPNDEVGAVTYTAPAAVPLSGTVTVTATSAADTSISASATITIVPPIPISVSFFGAPPVSLQVNSAISMRALVENDVSANPEVKWAVTCGAAACGAFNPATTPSEQPATYTAPAAIPPGGTVTVTATSVTDPTKSVSTSIAITAQAPTLANGTYVFHISGGEAGSAELITGVLVAQNGAITGGEQDAVYNDGDYGPYSSFQQIAGGSYTTTPSGNVQISLQIAVNGGETLTGTLASGAKGFIAGIDGAPGSGTLDLQTGTAAPAGGYAITLGAGDLYDGSPWVGGVVNVDGAGTISGSGSVLDVNGEGTYYGGTETPSASTVSAPDAYGRVVFQLNPGASSSVPVLYVAGYLIDPAHIRVMEVGNAMNSYATLGEMSGTALGQGTNTGRFSASSIAGASYVIGAAGEDAQGALQLAGVFHFNAGGTVSGTLNWNDLSGKSAQPPLAFTGSYAVDPTGRVSVSNVTDGATFKYSFHLYLDGNGGGLVASSDGNDVFAGQAFEQQTGAFTAASFSGSYGLNAGLYGMESNGVPNWANAIGLMTAASGSGTDAVAGFADVNYAAADVAISGSFTPGANGVFTGTLAGLDGATAATASSFALYLVDGTQGVAIETDDNALTLGRLQLVQ